MPLHGRPTGHGSTGQGSRPESPGPGRAAHPRPAAPFAARNPAQGVLPEALDALTLSVQAVELLAATVSRGGLDRRRRREQPGAAAELQEAGLLTADAFLTDRGHRMVAPWRLAERRLALGSRSPGDSTRLDIWTGDGTALLLSGTTTGHEQLSLLPLASLTPVLARRTGSPASGFAGGFAAGERQVLLLDGQEYEDRIAGARVPVPEGAGAQVQALLEADWTEWTLVDQSSGEGFSWISAEGCEPHAADLLPDGGTAVEAIAPSTLQDILMCLVYAVPEQPGLTSRPSGAGRKQLRQQRGH